ncbi:hypothetical protein SDRG_13483 [Saprolegnia diclina VS20]|uniref:Uncharacterized protein n=1 Tax=Saprolegnia diclina (strain VS20) TaxID=1156394 RepID=T0RGH2_SAPDV|nr:hypothetical protein SDRG_13483 [Saprolegnia diclina VS20]EQC28802.1 hypothetical protein SDRG_13483 [Saprolegnia diclina VS20]|eukprot:XP_008617797.1 hypothetical protein SDRG_13483 [Saprolegnia diclina VS20]
MANEDAPTCATHSLLLYAGAKYLYTTDRWLYNGVYYLDRASAVLSPALAGRRVRL